MTAILYLSGFTARAVRNMLLDEEVGMDGALSDKGEKA